MAINRWDPYRDLVTLRQRMDKFFDDFFSEKEEPEVTISGAWSPKVDICDHQMMRQKQMRLYCNPNSSQGCCCEEGHGGRE